MVMSSRPTLTLEFNLQDVFFALSSGEPTEAKPANPIDPATWDNWFQAWLETLAADLPQAEIYELTLRLTSDREIQSLNAQYRHKNQPTDVLAFASLEVESLQASDEFSFEPLYLGDIIISVETASRQAQDQGHTLKQELAWLAVHGFLHLLGWDHPDEESLLEMISEQETLLQLVGLLPEGQ